MGSVLTRTADDASDEGNNVDWMFFSQQESEFTEPNREMIPLQTTQAAAAGVLTPLTTSLSSDRKINTKELL